METVIIRHPKERLNKCSLTPLEGRSDFKFFKAQKGFEFDATGYTLLEVGAPVLSEEDSARPFLLLDSTWRLLPEVQACVKGDPVKRSIPSGVKTVYPRVSKISEDPDGGLASVEALYVALKMMGRDDESILDKYHWKKEFLETLGVRPC